MLQGMSQADLEEALKEPTDPEVIVRVLEFSKFQSPVTKARLRAAGMKLALLERGGGTYGSSQVAELLGVQRQSINKRVKAKTLLALERGKHGYVYPACQFVDGDTLPGLGDVLRSLDATIDPWMALAFFLNGNCALDGSSPLDALRRGDIEGAVRAARLHGEHGAP